FTPGETETLQEIVSSSWVNFAKNGDPNGGVVPEWKAITENENYTMIFDRESKLALSHDADLLSLMPEVTVSLAGLMGKKK
ncbi:MAG: carboxylesterase family protein, partial [Christensenellaceae bacterium]|nr:carboxylesterase family protein [Christensenellaceae bacterium]